MDLIASLHLPELPEQQTHISSHVQGILDAAEGSSDLRLGFNVCCCCAVNKVTTVCPGCNRVRYCSQKCLDLDSSRSKRKSRSDESDAALGHTAVICSLLQICQVDEDVEDQQHNNGGSVSSYTKDQIDASQDRIRSEYESYPATIANILLDTYFENMFSTMSSKQQRRCKRDRDRSGHSTINKKNLVIHVVGASEESELWGDFHGSSAVDNVYDAYTDAFTDIASLFHLTEIRLIFIGPNCPILIKPVEKVIASDPSLMDKALSHPTQSLKRKQTDAIREIDTCKLIVEAYPCDYDSTLWNEGFTYQQLQKEQRSARDLKKGNKSDDIPKVKLPKADVVFFFNPGFTCPDYAWEHTLQSLCKGIPFIVATNTEMEALADIQCLHDMGMVSENAESIVEILHKDGFGNSLQNYADSSKGVLYFGENPFSGIRVRQNGTMANDLYVKNRWLFIVAGAHDQVNAIVQKEKGSNNERLGSDVTDGQEKMRNYFI